MAAIGETPYQFLILVEIGPMAERFLTMEQVRERVSLSKTEIYRKINRNEFPRPVPLGAQKVAFVESEIDEWMQLRLRARAEGEGAARRSKQGRDAVVRREGKQ